MATYKTLCAEIDAHHASGDVDKLLAAVRKLAMRRLYDDDAAQEVTLRTWANRCAVSGSFAAYVNRAITNRKTDGFRLTGRRAEVWLDPEREEAAEDEREPEIVYPCQRSREAFELKAEGYSDAEVAKLLGVTPGSLGVQFTRWRKKIYVRC